MRDGHISPMAGMQGMMGMSNMQHNGMNEGMNGMQVGFFINIVTIIIIYLS